MLLATLISFFSLASLISHCHWSTGFFLNFPHFITDIDIAIGFFASVQSIGIIVIASLRFIWDLHNLIWLRTHIIIDVGFFFRMEANIKVLTSAQGDFIFHTRFGEQVFKLPF